MDQQQDQLWTKGFLGITLCGFLLFLNLQMLISSLPAYLKEQFQASDFSIGVITGLFALSSVAARLFAGRPGQKERMGRLLFLGLFIAWIATAGTYWCHALIAILGIRMVYGFGFGVASTVLPTMASNRVPLARMGEGMGYFGFSNTLGLSVGPLIGMYLLANYGFGTLTAAASIVLLLIFPIIYGVLPGASTMATGAVRGKSSQGNTYFSRKLVLPAILNMLLSITYSGLIGFIALFGLQRNIEGVGSFFLVQSLMVLLIRPFAGKIFDRRGPVAAVIPGGFLVMLGVIFLSYSDRLLELILSAVVYGCGYGMIQPSIQAWMIKEVSADERGIANGMFYNSIDAGVALGSILLGVLASGVGYGLMYLLSSLFMALFLLIFGLSIMLTRHRNKVTQNM
ncbi:MFS transporter [Paenibacillus validus]|uniref:MFS transporter n=1 Tax=Paenibacillus validus TaxID=44253 RepID=UPI000FD80E4F|nr:MFS transporter [Paenibacillus validus]MED4601207.1 MFS transporter [Paenibacillus validus]MED4606910.1 MFS transporter [Paenibacillus validus]